MPTRERVREYIATVEQGQTLAAIANFYAEHASMQENGGAPRVGLGTLLDHERKMLSRVSSLSLRAASCLVDGDQVAINWVIDMQPKAGSAPTQLDEIALQDWAGDKIVRERFYYDPASLRPK